LVLAVSLAKILLKTFQFSYYRLAILLLQDLGNVALPCIVTAPFYWLVLDTFSGKTSLYLRCYWFAKARLAAASLPSFLAVPDSLFLAFYNNFTNCCITVFASELRMSFLVFLRGKLSLFLLFLLVTNNSLLTLQLQAYWVKKRVFGYEFISL
jgi:hypothetical protein